MLEVAGVKLTAGRMQPHAGFQRLVQPGEPIPQAATAVHGIDAAKVAGAPVFAAVWPEFSAFIGSSLVIGHTVGFDLAIIKRECERAGLTWTRPRTLDTRLLAEIVAPDLADYSLESIAEWLEVEVVDATRRWVTPRRRRVFSWRCCPSFVTRASAPWPKPSGPA